ncbi:hypothetical protein [Arcanobacterium buesumense]|nr:hypothetical protein [Arcanobacterium buesumense]
MRRQPYRTHYLLASLAVLLLTTVLFPLPSFAVMTTTDTEDAANQEWFATIGTELMRSQATDVFGQDIANDPLLLSVGVAHHVYTFSDKKDALRTPDTAFEESRMWVAPVVKGDSPVGVMTTEGSGAARRTNAKVVADPRLATEAAASRTETNMLVYDPELKAWFVYRDGMIEPGDSAGSGFVLGSITFETFIDHRRELIDNDNLPVVAPAKPLGPTMKQSHMTAERVIIVIAILTGLVIFSVAWLRWDQNKNDPYSKSNVRDTGDNTHRHRRNRWDPFAQARLLIHPQQSERATTPSMEETK